MDFTIITKYEGMENKKACHAIAKEIPAIPYRRCSLAARVGAIVIAIFSLGLPLLFERWRLACKGFSSIKLDARFFMTVAKRLNLNFKNHPMRTIQALGADRAKIIVQEEYKKRYFSEKNPLPYRLN